MSLETVICPENCLTDLPEVNFSACAPKFKTSEISYIYITKRGEDFVNWADGAEWATRISSAGTAQNAVRKLVGIGEKPLSEKQEIAVSDGRTYTSSRDFTINFEVDDNSDENYDFSRYAAACNPSYSIWYQTSDGYLYGGNEGIPASVSSEEPITNNRKELRKLSFVFKWSAVKEPVRILSPIAA